MVGESLHLPGPCQTPQSSQRAGVIPLRAGALVSGSASPSPPQSLFLHISLLVFSRMSERDIQSLSKWVFVLSLCLTTLWGRLTLASTHQHRSHSGRGARPLLHVSHACAVIWVPVTMAVLWVLMGCLRWGLRGDELLGEALSHSSCWGRRSSRLWCTPGAGGHLWGPNAVSSRSSVSIPFPGVWAARTSMPNVWGSIQQTDTKRHSTVPL